MIEDEHGNLDLQGLLESDNYVPPNIRASKTESGTLVWVINETTGHALSATFVPDAFHYSNFSSPENSNVSLNELSKISSEHVHVHNPRRQYDGSSIPLNVWVVNK